MRSFYFSFVSALLSLFLLQGCAVLPTTPQSTATKPVRDCKVVRAAFDIGSGATRVKVANVDRCKSKVLEVLLEREEKVDFKEDLSQNNSRMFSEQMMANGLKVLRTLKEEAEKFSPKEYVAVATAAFREAKNGQKYIEKINSELWISARILQQSEEARLGFYGSAESIGATPENTIVWDVGGSSQQIIKYNGDGRFSIYEGKLGSVEFKNYILRRVKRTQSRSPNPMNDYQVGLAVKHAETTANRTIKKDIKNFLRNSKDVKVLGIGGVHYHSVRNQIDPSGEKDFYTVGDVEKTLKAKIGKTDADLGNSKFVDTEVSNLALIFGFMKALNIYEVRTAKINMTDGLLLDHKYWMP